MKRFALILMRWSLVALTVAFFVPPVFAQPSGPLSEGIRQYQADNLEEAVELFKKAREANPDSSEAAFWLGLTYKQQNSFQEALQPLRDAVMIKPPIREALVELIDVLFRLEKLEEAKKWLDLAEREGIFPAKTAFLKGMILAKESRYPESITSFEKAKTLDKSYTQAADFQIGLSYMLDRKYRQAADVFRAAVTQDPVSDLAAFARRYQDLVEERSWIERPVRMTVGMMGQYDTNMLQEPYAHPGLPDAGDQKSFALMSTLRLDIVPTLPGQWLFNGGYALSSKVHENNGTSHDLLANTFSIAPGYNFGRVALNLSANYTHVMKKNPSYERYSSNYTVGPLMRFLLTEEQDHILEFYAGYARKYYYTPPLDPNELQDASGLDSYLSWIWLFQNGAMLNVKYGFTTENADGPNWTNEGHRFTANAIIPLMARLRLQLGVEVFRQAFANESTIPAFNQAKRRDRTLTGIAGLTWDLNKQVSLLLQYMGVRADSNIFIYDFDRNVYSAGAEIRF